MRNYVLCLVIAILSLGGAAYAQSAPAHATSAHKASAPFRDCSDCPEMITVPTGSFTMGISTEAERHQDAPAQVMGRTLPLHTVTFSKAFSIGRDPITIAQFRTFVEESGYKAGDACYVQHPVDGHFIYENANGFNYRSPSYPVTDAYPAVCVSWEDAMAYSAWLSKKTGHTYSLPNEAQFEYAQRAGTHTAFFWGDEQDATACRYANLPDFAQARALGNVPTDKRYRFPCDDGYAFTSPIGTYQPNAWGLRDMFGNIWHWMADCWNDNMKGAPVDGSTWLQGDCDARAYRGGSHGNTPNTAYAGMRAARDPEFRGHSWGFRVVRND